MSKINFFTEDIAYSLKNKTKLRSWISNVIKDNHKHISWLNYIFTSDQYLLSINKTYLDHDSFTDIITFDQSANTNSIEADIFISIDRIKENSKNLQIPFQDELHRVMIHGVLHLIGLNDKSDAEKKEMRKKENHYLALRV